MKAFLLGHLSRIEQHYENEMVNLGLERDLPNPARRQKEQGNQCSSSNLRILLESEMLIQKAQLTRHRTMGHSKATYVTYMMRSGTRRRPSSSLPTLHSLQLSRFINLYHAIYFPIRMHMILTRKNILAIHVHCRDAEIVGLRRRETDFASAVFGPLNFDVGYPAFSKSLSNARAYFFVVRVPGPIFGVELFFQSFAGRAVCVGHYCFSKREWRTHRLSISLKNF